MTVTIPALDSLSLPEHLLADREGIDASLAGLSAPHSARLGELACAAIRGGKRLRPLLGCAMMRTLGRDPRPAYDLLAAVELMHCGTILHDDVIDGSETRRNQPTGHVRFDPHTAILAGDFLLSAGIERLARGGPPALLATAAAALSEVCQGEALEREQRHDPEVDLARARRVNHLKTAVLFGYAAEAGTTLADGSDAERAAARSFGRALGDAFQAVDDLLDWVGDGALLGKPTGRDLLDGLVTVPVALGCGLDRGLRREVRLVLEARAAGRQDHPPMAGIKAALEAAGAFRATRELAAQDVAAAQAALSFLPPGAWRDWLARAAFHVLDRNA